MTTSRGGGQYSVWSPGGEYLYFTSNRSGTLNLDCFRRRADGSLPAEQLFARQGGHAGRAVSEGDSIVIVRTNEAQSMDLLLMRMGPDGSVPDSATFDNYLTAEWNWLHRSCEPRQEQARMIKLSPTEERELSHRTRQYRFQ